jgi:hypothetical protein
MNFLKPNLHPSIEGDTRRAVLEVIETADGMMSGLSRRTTIIPARMCMQWAAVAFASLHDKDRGMIQAGSASWQFAHHHDTDGDTNFVYQYEHDPSLQLTIGMPMPEIHAWLVAEIEGEYLIIDLTARYIEAARDKMLPGCPPWNYKDFPSYDVIPIASYSKASCNYDADVNAINLAAWKIAEWFVMAADLTPTQRLRDELGKMRAASWEDSRKVVLRG